MGASVFCCQGTLAYTGVYCLTYNRRYGALFFAVCQTAHIFYTALVSAIPFGFLVPDRDICILSLTHKYVKYKFQKN